MISKKGFEIVKPSDVTQGLINYRNNYNDRGKYLGFDRLDPHYSMMLGTCTDWTGFPRSGKTQVLMELLLNTSMWYGWKHLVYFPDVGNKIEILADLIHKKTGKTFNPNYGNVIEDSEIYHEINWITEHFKVLTKTDVKAKLTPFEFWDMAVEIKNEQGLQTASIDSWKDMSHPYNEYGGYATYLEVVLPYRNQIAEDNDLHLHTIIHPKLTEKVNGVRQAPTPYDLKGGSEWFNSGKCMITVHRETMDTKIADITIHKAKPRECMITVHRETMDTKIADITIHKAKPRACGSMGTICLEFDIAKLVYFENSGYGSVYASPRGQKKEEPLKVETNTIKQVNTDFDNEIDFNNNGDEVPF